MLTPEQQQKLIAPLLSKPENLCCADCSSKSPGWVSLDFGVFICLNCSGAHRSLGPSTTRVRSTKLDKWNRQWLWFMQLGNQAINQYFEYKKQVIGMKYLNIIQVIRKPNLSSSLNQIKKFVQDKYVKRIYANPNKEDPITELKKGIYNANQTAPVQKQKKKQEVNVAPIEKKQIQQKPRKQSKKIVEIDLLGDHTSNYDVASNSIQNCKKKQEINLFDDFEVQKKPTKLYNKQHFNSFSGAGASHSTTGHFSFDELIHSNQNKKNDFDQFKLLTNQVRQHNKAVFSTMGSNHQNNNFNHHQNYNHPNNHNKHNYNSYMPQVPHVTMNINMNMYPNYLNINLNGANMNTSQQQSSQKNTSVPQKYSINLDLNDFKDTAKPENVQNKQRSWVDQWK